MFGFAGTWEILLGPDRLQCYLLSSGFPQHAHHAADLGPSFPTRTWDMWSCSVSWLGLEMRVCVLFYGEHCPLQL